MKIKLEAAARLTATSWWDALDKDQKQEYISEHPDSKYAKQGTGGESADKPKALEDGLKSPGPLKEPPALEEGPGEVPESPVAKKPAPKTKSKKSKEDSLIRYLLEKGGEAAKEKAKELVKKGGHEFLKRLIDPMGLTHHKDSRRGHGTKHRPSKSKTGTKPKSDGVSRMGKEAPGRLSKVKKLVSPGYKKAGAHGISPFGYWKDKDTWVSETEEEWESKLTPKERKHYGR